MHYLIPPIFLKISVPMGIHYWHEYIHDAFYHIYNRSSNDRNIFTNKWGYNFFLDKYQHYFSLYFDTYAYCLLPNHYHFLVKVKNEKEILPYLESMERTKAINLYLRGQDSINSLIEDQFRRFHSSYALKHNIKNRTRGQLFVNRHKRVVQDTTAKIEYLLCYIHHNPIHHNFHTNFTDWPYSSYLDYLNEDNRIIDVEAGLNIMGGFDRFLMIHDQFKFEKFRDIEKIGN